MRERAKQMLEAHFPESLHESISAAVGLDMAGTARGARRDPSFRADVIAAWGHQRAFCGYSVQLVILTWDLKRPTLCGAKQVGQSR